MTTGGYWSIARGWRCGALAPRRAWRVIGVIVCATAAGVCVREARLSAVTLYAPHVEGGLSLIAFIGGLTLLAIVNAAAT